MHNGAGNFPGIFLGVHREQTHHAQWAAATAYLRALSTPINEDQRDVMRRPVWVPEPWVPVRPGADDHKQHKSFGT